MTPSAPVPDPSDQDALRRWMKQTRDTLPHDLRDSPATPEEFAAVQRSRLLNSAEARPALVERRRIDVALTGAATNDHIVGLSTLGSFLTNFQESVAAVAQALSGRPTSSAAIPRDIRDATALSAAATFPSSFGVTIYGPPDTGEQDLFGSEIGALRTILDETVEKILTIVDISEGGGSSDELLAEQLVPLGQRSIKHIGALTAGLSNSGVGMRISWHSQEGRVRRSSWSESGVQRVRFLCEHSEFAEVETITLTGWLGSASSFRGTVEIRTDSGEIIQASTSEDTTTQLDRYFNRRVTARIEVASVKFAGGRERKVYSVVELHNA